MLLKKLGCFADVAANGEEAATMAQAMQYDVILMDCEMPVMDGYAATTAIRTREKSEGGHIPIVALTANVTDEAKRKCMNCGADDYITKPVTQKILQSVLEQYTKKL